METEREIKIQILKVTTAQLRERPLLSGHLENYFVRKTGIKLPRERMDALHRVYNWLQYKEIENTNVGTAEASDKV